LAVERVDHSGREEPWQTHLVYPMASAVPLRTGSLSSQPSRARTYGRICIAHARSVSRTYLS